RLFARFAFLSSLSVSLTQPPSRYRRANRAPENETEASLPPLLFYRGGARGARPAAPRLDRPRRAATDRDSARRRDIIRCRGRFFFLGGDEADAAVAILALADFPEPVFRAQLIEPCDKLRHRQGHALRGTAPGLVVGIESAFRKRLRVRCRLDALGEIIDHQSQRFTGLFATTTVSRFRISRQNSRSEGGDEFDRHRKKQGEPRADIVR